MRLIPASLLTLALSGAAPPAAVTIASDDPVLEFSYAWPAEAASIPALDRRFRSDAARMKRDALALAMQDREVRDKDAIHPMSHSFSRSWETAGQSKRLLSLRGSVGTFTGGAHPNGGSSSILWDRKLGRDVTIAALLLPGQSWNGAIRQPFCTLLDRERAGRRKERIVRGEWPNQCPELNELTMVLADRNRNGRLDHVDVTADAYVAGPYAEGPYEVSLPLTAAMLARLRPEYRDGFEPQPPVQ
jgi:hypothetical protein